MRPSPEPTHPRPRRAPCRSPSSRRGPLEAWSGVLPAGRPAGAGLVAIVDVPAVVVAGVATTKTIATAPKQRANNRSIGLNSSLAAHSTGIYKPTPGSQNLGLHLRWAKPWAPSP